LLHSRRARADGADLLEVRADLFPGHLLKPEPLRSLLKDIRRAAKLPLLLTLRSRAEGGRLHRSVDEQDRLSLIRAALSEVDVVDVELSSEDLLEHVLDEAHKRGRRVILSAHDFKKTPSNLILKRLVGKFRALKGDVLKVAVMPAAVSDVERMKLFFSDPAVQKTCGRVVAIVMGPRGRRSRLDPSSWGSCMTYGFVGRAAAPGQIPVKSLRRVLDAAEQRSADKKKHQQA
jgi:3-dehydroquinate dehydratase-1